MITSQDLRAVTAFKDLDDGALALIASRTADLRVEAGETVLTEGDVPHFFAVLSGALEVSKHVGEASPVLTTFLEGDSFGEISLMLGSPAVATVRAAKSSRLAVLETTEFWRLMRTQQSFAKAVSAHMSTRIPIFWSTAMQNPTARCTIVGDPNSPECHRLRDFLTRLDVQFDWEERSGPHCDVTFEDGRRLVSPSVRELAQALGLRTSPQSHCYDVAIIGAGPAGLAAAVYGASEGLRTILVDGDAPGGQAGMSSRIENYLGFPNGISGEDLAERAYRQATRFGADVVVTREAIRIEGAPYDRRVILDENEEIHCRSVVLATGVCYRYLTASGCNDFLNRGVYYGAAQAEARQVHGRRVHLLGGGNSAGQAAMFFSLFAEQATIIIRSDDLSKSMSQYLMDELKTRPNVSVIANSEVVSVEGGRTVETLSLRNVVDGTERRERTDALFVFIGADPRTEWLAGFVSTDERGYILTGQSIERLDHGWPLARPPFLLETNQPGVFAVGDVRKGSVKRVASGVGEGATAITMVHQILDEMPAKSTREVARL